MTTRTFSFAPGEFYHVYNRGVEKRIVYKDIYDYNRFKQLLYVANTTDATDFRAIERNNPSIYDFDQSDKLVSIGAYCLMPNHFHILLTPIQDGGVTAFMNKLNTSYVMYFNKKYDRSGALYEGKFKAKHTDSDEYLKYLFAYIHLNPIKLMQADWKEAGISDTKKAYEYVSNFNYSSLADYQMKPRPEVAILNTERFPDYFQSTANRKSELIHWLEYDK
jgi:putative transposase